MNGWEMSKSRMKKTSQEPLNFSSHWIFWMPEKPAHREKAFRSAPALRSLGPASELHGVFRSGTLPSTSGE